MYLSLLVHFPLVSQPTTFCLLSPQPYWTGICWDHHNLINGKYNGNFSFLMLFVSVALGNVAYIFLLESLSPWLLWCCYFFFSVSFPLSFPSSGSPFNLGILQYSFLFYFIHFPPLQFLCSLQHLYADNPQTSTSSSDLIHASPETYLRQINSSLAPFYAWSSSGALYSSEWHHQWPSDANQMLSPSPRISCLINLGIL